MIVAGLYRACRTPLPGLHLQSYTARRARWTAGHMQSAQPNMFAAFACGASTNSPAGTAQRNSASSALPSAIPPIHTSSRPADPANLPPSAYQKATAASGLPQMRNVTAKSTLLARQAGSRISLSPVALAASATDATHATSDGAATASTSDAPAQTADASASHTAQDIHFAATSSSPAAHVAPAAAAHTPNTAPAGACTNSTLSSSPSAPGTGSKRRRLSGEPPKGVVEKLGQQPLRLIIVGHNPSDHAWQTGHYYSNPSNRMWPILIKTGIAPPGTTGPEADDAMPAAVGVGFTDVGTGHPGTESKDFSSATFEAWGDDFYHRLEQQMRAASKSIGCVCGKCGAPALVAFSGKRQYLELLNRCRPKRTPKVTTVPVGPQALLPRGWPLPATATEVWVCSSTSGASALTNEAREGPYVELAQRLGQIPWPRDVVPACAASAGQTVGSEGAGVAAHALAATSNGALAGQGGGRQQRL